MQLAIQPPMQSAYYPPQPPPAPHHIHPPAWHPAHIYPSPPGHEYPDAPFNPPALPQHQEPYPGPRPSDAHSPTDPPQVDSSIGPSRVLTRRQRAALEHGHLARRVSAPANFPGGESNLQRHPSMYINSSVAMSRPQTPNQEPNPYQPPRESLSLNMPGASVMQPSPGYHPLTPSSSSSPYSSYGFYSTTHSRSNSLSNSTHPRSASPALSTTSALTSVSSGSGPNSFALPPSSALAATRMKQKKQRLFNVDRKDICVYAKENPNARQEDIARIYGVERSTISKILKNKTKWLNVPADEALRIAKHRPSKFPEVEEDMVKWLVECRDSNTVLSDSMIRTKAKEIARDLGIPDEKFKASSGWIENFKHRHGVRAGVWTGDGKNNRAARALGLGGPEVHDTILSPLNPAFDVEQDDMMDDGESAGAEHHSGEAEYPPELSPEPEDARIRQMDTSDSSAPVRPSWLLNPVEPISPPLSQPSTHPSVPPSRQLPDHSQHAAPTYTGDRPVYDVVYQAPPLPENQPTTLEDAEIAINKVINFVDTRGHGILQPNERTMLTTIKCALFQAASGIPYDRGEGR